MDTKNNLPKELINQLPRHNKNLGTEWWHRIESAEYKNWYSDILALFYDNGNETNKVMESIEKEIDEMLNLVLAAENITP
jgi:hypothetical protein